MKGGILRRTSRTLFAGALLALGVLCALPGRALASAFNVRPTQIHLSTKVSSGLLTVRNESAEALRFQMSVFTWNQSAKGEIQLTPTRDVVFFPALLTLAPGEERKIRIGTSTPAGLVEKTYRIFVEELPPAVKAEDVAKKKGSEVKVLTRMGVPIFIEPASATAGARIEPKTLRSDKLAFEVKNTGNVHFQIRRAVVKGLGPAKESLFERTVPGWYVLAGGSRVFEVQTPKDVCGKTKSLAFKVETEQTTLESQLDTRTGICGP
jgi:fimbrial chaperone protein